MNENILVRLFEHNNWANQRLLQACSTLTEEQLDAEPRSVTKGSLRLTLTHLVSAQRGYLALLTLPVDQRPSGPVEFSSLAESARVSGSGLVDFVRSILDGAPQERRKTRDNYLVEPWVVLLQVLNHAGEHREQICSMLSALGIQPPDLDGWSYGSIMQAFTPMAG